jgi:hypothetical protein
LNAVSWEIPKRLVARQGVGPLRRFGGGFGVRWFAMGLFFQTMRSFSLPYDAFSCSSVASTREQKGH